MQTRTLVRARNLASFRDALATLAVEGGALEARRRLVILPTRASAELLRQTIEMRAQRAARHATVLPDLGTRDTWLDEMQTALPGASRLLTRPEREILLWRGVLRTADVRHVRTLPFEPRPGLISVMLDFYDELKRRQRNVRRFARALFDELRVERGTDRGSEELIRLTRVLGFSFLAYERGVARSGRDDEHVQRARLLAEQPALPFDHLVIAVADHPSDPRGLWPADFDLIGRLRQLARVDVVMTDEAHDAGFRDRLEHELPGIIETRAPDVERAPVIIRPRTDTASPPVFLSRDREEELRDLACDIRSVAETADGVLRRDMAVVFHRPLPYLYLAQQVLGDAGVPYQAFDALPLAAEPYAAFFDLVLVFARTGGTREAAIALLRSNLAKFDVDGRPVMLEDASALDRVLAERRSTGEATEYIQETIRHFQRDGRHSARGQAAFERAHRAAVALAACGEELAVVRDTQAAASIKVRALAAFLRRHEHVPVDDDDWVDRHVRARAAILGVLDELGDAYARHGDVPIGPDELTAVIHHAIEGRTFTPRRGDAGVHLVDAVAARFGDFDRVYLVGLSDTDWPERPRRNIFYAAGLLKVLGWPQHDDQIQAENAAFRDLLTLAAEETRLSAFQLEGDALVALSPMVEHARHLPVREIDVVPRPPLFLDELVNADVLLDGIATGPGAWVALRRLRPALTDPAYSGMVDPQAPRAYKVSRVDHYVDCPFRYFSENILQLPEERDDEAGLTPLERGTLLHSLFEKFFQVWQKEGYGAITSANIADALTRFGAIADDALAGMPEADRVLEETRLVGSLVGSGVAERVFELEADSGQQVVRRLLEQDLIGTFQFPVIRGLTRVERPIAIRGKADRVDVLDDGSLRVVDYKLGKMPGLDASVQIAVYAHCMRQKIEAEDGGSHPVSTAMYLAFGDPFRFDGRLGDAKTAVDLAVEARVGEFAATIDRIEAGEFPARPRRTGDCQWCRYKGVCRKEYAGDIDQTADPV